VNAIGIGPFSRSSGTILIENKTDYAKYPNLEKWSSNKLDITIWSATLSLNPLKFAPKISVGEDFEGTLKTPIFYSASDFSGADVQITEGKLFEVPIPLGSSSNVKGSTKLSKAAYIILVKGQGKALLEFNGQQDFFELPDTLELEPDIKGEQESTYEKIAKMLPSLTMYTGSIDEKKTSTDIQSIPLPDEFSSLYRIQDRRYFKHDNAELSPQAIEAIGRLCAEELIAFSDPESQVEIYGHTDASGKPAYNLDLSKTRALNTWQAINDQQHEKNPWLRTVVVIINGRAVLSLNAL
jgi:outer membrane protein OmpA-like peptidoglycan-associated protein